MLALLATTAAILGVPRAPFGEGVDARRVVVEGVVLTHIFVFTRFEKDWTCLLGLSAHALIRSGCTGCMPRRSFADYVVKRLTEWSCRSLENIILLYYPY